MASGCTFVSASAYRDVEELLFARGIIVTYEAIRKWCLKGNVSNMLLAVSYQHAEFIAIYK